MIVIIILVAEMLIIINYFSWRTYLLRIFVDNDSNASTGYCCTNE